MTYKSIAGVIPTVQAAWLLEDNIDFAKKKKKKAKGFTKQAVKNIVGVSLIGATSKIVSDL